MLFLSFMCFVSCVEIHFNFSLFKAAAKVCGILKFHRSVLIGDR